MIVYVSKKKKRGNAFFFKFKKLILHFIKSYYIVLKPMEVVLFQKLFQWPASTTTRCSFRLFKFLLQTKKQQHILASRSQIIHTAQFSITTTYLCYMISVYLKYSICKCFFQLKTRQISQLVAYIVSKKEKSIHQSFFLLNIYAVCLKALVGAWDKHWLGNAVMGSLRWSQDGRIWGEQYWGWTIKINQHDVLMST